MARKLFCSLFVMVVVIGFVAADEFQAQIVAVSKDGKTVSYYKTKKGAKGKAPEREGDLVKDAAVASDVVVAKGKYDKDDKKWTVGDKIEGGLTSKLFQGATDEKGVNVILTTKDDKISQILTAGGGKKKKDTE